MICKRRKTHTLWLLEGLEGLRGRQLKHKLLEKMAVSVAGRARFWKKVKKGKPDECWPWTGACKPKGYGMMVSVLPFERVEISAHRMSYLLEYGFLPPNLCVCHSCDNPNCQNPSHLFIGTYKDNSDDKVQKNRQAKGVGHGLNKLTPSQVQEIRLLRHFEGMRYKDIAELYGVNGGTIWCAINGRTWTYLPNIYGL